MNRRKSKTIKSIFPNSDPISRRNYRRAKKKYSALSSKAKPIFLEALKRMLSVS
jgi:hypothetical protein